MSVKKNTAKQFILQNEINSFVSAVETKKGFERNPDKVFRHIVSEFGELDGAMYDLERHLAIPGSGGGEGLRARICDELIDLLFLISYMADLYSVDINTLIPSRMASIAKQYDVKWPIKRRKSHG